MKNIIEKDLLRGNAADCLGAYINTYGEGDKAITEHSVVPKMTLVTDQEVTNAIKEMMIDHIYSYCRSFDVEIRVISIKELAAKILGEHSLEIDEFLSGEIIRDTDNVLNSFQDWLRNKEFSLKKYSQEELSAAIYLEDNLDENVYFAEKIDGEIYNSSRTK